MGPGPGPGPGWSRSGPAGRSRGRREVATGGEEAPSKTLLDGAARKPSLHASSGEGDLDGAGRKRG